jgi:hypothetical protein
MGPDTGSAIFIDLFCVYGMRAVDAICANEPRQTRQNVEGPIDDMQ